MKMKKSLCSIFLLSLILGTMAPVAVSATTDSATTTTESSTTTEEPSAPSSPSVEPSEPSSSDVPEPSSVVDPSSSEEATTEDATTTAASSTTEATTTEEDDSPTSALEKAGVLEAIIGKDDQYRVKNTTAYPYRRVVHLTIRFGNQYYVGTGALISRNTVLTVAHNIFDQKTKKWASSVTVTPGKNGSKAPYGTYTSSKYYTFRRYTTEGNKVPSNYDMAVLRLDKSVPASIGSLSVSTSLSKGQRVQIPGYPAYTSSKSGYMYTSFGKVNSTTSQTLGHLVDTEGGNSGSPILNSKYQIVGVHSAGLYTHGTYGTNNYGRRIDKQAKTLISKAKSNGGTTIDITHNREGSSGKVYRLYHKGIKRHLYTKSLNEANILTTRGWKYEGAKFNTASSGKPVYRLYGKVMREHLYTTSKAERDALVKTGAWRSEGTAWYSAGSKPVYRLYHKGLKVHLYTKDKNEVNVLSKRGWKREGISFYTK